MSTRKTPVKKRVRRKKSEMTKVAGSLSKQLSFVQRHLRRWQRAVSSILPSGAFFRKRRKEIGAMSSKLNAALSEGTRRHPFWAVVFAFLLALSLAACGGGGSSNLDGEPPTVPPTSPDPDPDPVPDPDPDPDPTPAPTVTSFTVDDAVILVNEGTVVVKVKYATTNTNDLKVTSGDVTKSVAAGSGEVTFTVTGPGNPTFVLTEDGVKLKEAKAKVSCGDNAWDAAAVICREVLAHRDVVVGVWDPNNRFYFVGETGFTTVTNKTPWNNFNANLFYYFGGIKQGVTDEFCRIRVVAVDSVAQVWRQMYIDAKRGELHVLPGTEEVLDFDPRDGYDFVHAYDPAVLNAAAYAKVSTGEYFTPADAEFNLFFKPNGQEAKAVFSWVGKEGGNLKIMRASTCTAASGTP